MKATIDHQEIAVAHHCYNHGREHLTIDCPEGWDDVKKLVNKVLTFEGRKFVWKGWNSDRNVCFFVGGTTKIATIQVGQHVKGKSTGSAITGFPANKSIYGTVVSIRECLSQCLVDVKIGTGTIIPCRIETIEIHGQ